MQITELSLFEDSVYYRESFLLFIENHREIILAKATPVDVFSNTVLSTYVYEGDVIGLLQSLKVYIDYIPIILLINKLITYNQSLDELKIIYIPSMEQVERLLSFYYTMFPE
jgi:hypothetical protein